LKLEYEILDKPATLTLVSAITFTAKSGTYRRQSFSSDRGASLAHILVARQTGFGAIVFQVFIPAKLAFKGEIERSLLIFLASRGIKAKE